VQVRDYITAVMLKSTCYRLALLCAEQYTDPEQKGASQNFPLMCYNESPQSTTGNWENFDFFLKLIVTMKPRYWLSVKNKCLSRQNGPSITMVSSLFLFIFKKDI